MNISGIFVQTTPVQLEAVKARLLELPGVEVHGEEEDGRLVVVIDEPSDRPSGEALMKIQNVEGVLSASLVYQHIEDDQTDSKS